MKIVTPAAVPPSAPSSAIVETPASTTEIQATPAIAPETIETPAVQTPAPAEAAKKTKRQSKRLTSDDDLRAFHTRGIAAATEGQTRNDFFEAEGMTPGVGLDYLYQAAIKLGVGAIAFPEKARKQPSIRVAKPGKDGKSSVVGHRLIPRTKEQRPMLNVPGELVIESGLAQGIVVDWSYADGVFTGKARPATPSATAA